MSFLDAVKTQIAFELGELISFFLILLVVGLLVLAGIAIFRIRAWLNS